MSDRPAASSEGSAAQDLDTPEKVLKAVDAVTRRFHYEAFGVTPERVGALWSALQGRILALRLRIPPPPSQAPAAPASGVDVLGMPDRIMLEDMRIGVTEAIPVVEVSDEEYAGSIADSLRDVEKLLDLLIATPPARSTEGADAVGMWAGHDGEGCIPGEASPAQGEPSPTRAITEEKP